MGRTGVELCYYWDIPLLEILRPPYGGSALVQLSG